MDSFVCLSMYVYLILFSFITSADLGDHHHTQDKEWFYDKYP